MQIRCRHCTKTLLLPADGALPQNCPHCQAAPGPGMLGAYEPVRLLAAGGMGEVYLARHRELGTEVAIKLLRPMPLDQLPALRERFAREARLAARVAHPGVVRVLASELADDRPYLVLELVRGRTLRTLLAGGPPTIAEALRLAIATAEVLAEAHAHGVLHRDVKPDNVMVQDDGRVRVLDFGIARAIADDAPLTRTGELVGTPEYMAPEQLLEGPEAVDARTDVHALGVLTYELLSGRSPFRGNSLFQTLKLVESLTPPPPSSLREQVPAEVDGVVRRALHKDPRERPPDAGAFAAALRATMPGPSRDGGAVQSRRQALVVGLALLVGAALGSKWLPAPEPIVPLVVPRTSGELRAVERAEIAQHLASGRWLRALHRAERLAAAGDPAAMAQAREAFVLHHTVWPQLIGLPDWLGACDEAERRRLFVDDVELAAQPADVPIPGRASAVDVTLRSLLAARGQGDEALLGALQDHAQRLPIDEPEHWLTQLAARHLRGDALGREQAAEQAWLHGAGELAVLLDAGAAVLPRGAAPAALVRPAGDARALRWRRRVLAAVGADAPAAVLLHSTLAALGDETPQLHALRAVPRRIADQVAPWFVGLASVDPAARDQLLLASVVLGSRPDYAAAPWSAVEPDRRRVLDAEVQRGR